MSKKHNLKIVGDHTLHCAGCERSKTFSLSQLPGVDEVKADWNTQKIELELSSDEIDVDKIKTELDWIGYQVELV